MSFNFCPTFQNVKVLLDVIKSYCIPSDRQFWSTQDFNSRVMTLVNTCDWANRNEQIVCGIFFGAAHRDVQRKALLKDKSLTVKDGIEHFASYEAAHDYPKQLLTQRQSVLYM